MDFTEGFGAPWGMLVFAVGLLIIPTAVHLLLLTELSCWQRTKPSHLRQRWPYAVATACSVAGSALGLVLIVNSLGLYEGFATWVVVLGVLLIVLWWPWSSPNARRRSYGAGWRYLVRVGGAPVLGVTLLLVLFAVLSANPWLPVDTSRTAGNVPAAVIGGLMGATTGVWVIRTHGRWRAG